MTKQKKAFLRVGRVLSPYASVLAALMSICRDDVPKVELTAA
jgi:hypothetical protein